MAWQLCRASSDPIQARGRDLRTRGSEGGLGEAVEGVPGLGGRKEGWGGGPWKESRDQGDGRRSRGGRGRSPGTRGMEGGHGEAGEGVSGAWSNP